MNLVKVDENLYFKKPDFINNLETQNLVKSFIKEDTKISFFNLKLKNDEKITKLSKEGDYFFDKKYYLNEFEDNPIINFKLQLKKKKLIISYLKKELIHINYLLF